MSDLLPLTWADAREIALWLAWGAVGLWAVWQDRKPRPAPAK